MFNIKINYNAPSYFVKDVVSISYELTPGIVSSRFEIDGDVNKDDIDLNDYKIEFLSENIWNINSTYLKDESFMYAFGDAKTYNIKLIAFSQYFTFNNNTFRFKFSIDKDITIESRFQETIQTYFPIYSKTENEYTSTLLKTSSMFFETMHQKVAELYDNTDINEITPKYIEHLALTLGHNEDYLKKIGYTINSEFSFNDYDILKKFTENTYTSKELFTFRQFLLYSATLFKNKGTLSNVEKFFSYFDIDCDIESLYIKDWLGEIIQKITNNDEVSFGKLDYEFEVYNSKNLECNISIINNQLIIDNYFLKEIINIDHENIGILEYDSETNPYYYFLAPTLISKDNKIYWETNKKLNDSIPYTLIDKSFSENHIENILINNIPTILEYEIIDTDSTEVSEFITKRNVLKLKSETVLENLTINYNNIKQTDYITTIMNTEHDVKDAFYNIKFTTPDLSSHVYDYNFYNSSNDLSIIFRANKTTPSESYFKLNLGDKIYLSYCFVEDDRELEYKLELVDDIFQIVNPISYTPKELYEIQFSVVNDNVSLYIRHLEEETKMRQAFNNSKGYDISQNNEEWIMIFENVNLKNPSDFSLTDKNNNMESSEKSYIPNESGYWGICVEKSVIIIDEINFQIIDRNKIYYNEFEATKEFPNNFKHNNNFIENLNNYEEVLEKETIIKTDFNNTDIEISNQIQNNINSLYSSNINFEDYVTRLTITFNKDWLINNKYIKETENGTYTDLEKINNDIVIPFGKQKSQLLYETPVFAEESFLYKTDTKENFFNFEYNTPITEYQIIPSIIPESLVINVPEKQLKSYTQTRFRTVEYKVKVAIESEYGDYGDYGDYEEYEYVTKTKLEEYEVEVDSYEIVNVTKQTIDADYENINYDISNTIREDYDDQIHLQISNRLSQYIHSQEDFNIDFIYEEVLPQNEFKTIEKHVQSKCSEAIDLNFEFTNSKTPSLFYKYGTKNKELGIVFSSLKTLRDFKEQYKTDLFPEVTLFGLYDFIVPKYTIKNNFQKYDFKTHYDENGDEDPEKVIIEFFIPFGMIHCDTRVFGLEKVWVDSNIEIKLKNIYVKRYSDVFSYSNNILIIPENYKNKYEPTEFKTKYNSPLDYVNYFIGGTILMSCGLDASINYQTDSPTSFIIDKPLRNLLNNLTEDIPENVEWWQPTEVWRKYDTTIIDQSLNLSLLTNHNIGKDWQTRDQTILNKEFLNYNIYDLQKTVSEYIDNDDIKIPSYKIQLNDIYSSNLPKENDVFYAKMNCVLTYFGSIENLDIDCVKTRISPSKIRFDFYVPFYVYYEEDAEFDNEKLILEYGNFVENCYYYNNKKDYNIVLTPINMMNKLLSASIDDFECNDIISPLKTIEEWNKQFLDSIQIEYICSKIEEDNFLLYNKIGITHPEYLTNESVVQIDYDDGIDVDWRVEETVEITKTQFTANELINKPLYSWYDTEKEIKLNNYKLEDSKYTIQDNILNIEKDSLLEDSTISCKLNNYSNLKNKKVKEFDLKYNTLPLLYMEKSNLSKSYQVKKLTIDVLTEDFLQESIINSKTCFNLNENIFNNTNIYGSVVGKTQTLNLRNITQENSILNLINIQNQNYIFETNIYFKESKNNLNKDDRYFGFILGAEFNDSFLDNYYYVSVNTNNNDLTLYKVESDEMFIIDTYNERTSTTSLKYDTMYKLKIESNSKYIRVYFNNVEEDYKTIFVHDFNDDSFKDKEFNSAINLLLDMNDKTIINNQTSSYAKEGSFSGFILNNSNTYLHDLKYTTFKEENKILNNLYDYEIKNQIIEKYEETIGIIESVEFIDKIFNDKTLISINEMLYVYDPNNCSFFFIASEVTNIKISGAFVLFITTNKLNLIEINNDNSYTEHSLMIKDKLYTNDSFHQFLEYSNKEINDYDIIEDEILLYLREKSD